MPRRRADPGRCANGHELNDRNRYVLPSGKVECRKCRAAVAARLRKSKPQQKRRHDTCRVCARKKWPDRRSLCFRCAAAEQQPAQPMERYFADVVEIESAPAWVRRDPAEMQKWLRGRRRDQGRVT